MEKHFVETDQRINLTDIMSLCLLMIQDFVALCNPLYARL